MGMGGSCLWWLSAESRGLGIQVTRQAVKGCHGKKCGTPCLPCTDLGPEDTLFGIDCVFPVPFQGFSRAIQPGLATSLYRAAGSPCGDALVPT